MRETEASVKVFAAGSVVLDPDLQKMILSFDADGDPGGMAVPD